MTKRSEEILSGQKRSNRSKMRRDHKRSEFTSDRRFRRYHRSEKEEDFKRDQERLEKIIKGRKRSETIKRDQKNQRIYERTRSLLKSNGNHILERHCIYTLASATTDRRRRRRC